MLRENTKVIQIGNKVIGGGNPILIQSMTNTKTEDVEATVAPQGEQLIPMNLVIIQGLGMSAGEE